MQLPNFAKLAIAIIEKKIEPIIGSSAIEIIKQPLKAETLQQELRTALSNAEKRFLATFPDKDVKETLIQLPISDLPSLQESIVKFYENPTSPILENEIQNQFSFILGKDKARFALPASQYFVFVLEELALVAGINEKLVALSNIKSLYKLDSINITLLAILESLSPKQKESNKSQSMEGQKISVARVIKWARQSLSPEFEQMEKEFRIFDDNKLIADALEQTRSRHYAKALISWNELWKRYPSNQEYFSYLYLSATKLERERKIAEAVSALISKARSAMVLGDTQISEKFVQNALLISPSNQDAKDLLVILNKSKENE